VSTARDPGPARLTRRRVVLVAAVVLLAAVGAGAAIYRIGNDHAPADGSPPATGLTVDWGGSEGQPSCSYDPAEQTVEARITIDGTAPRADDLTVTVTAYADENTSQPVGSASRTVHVAGTVHERLLITIPVTRAPHVGEDDEAACARSVTY
jgi:hypothetical protein